MTESVPQFRTDVLTGQQVIVAPFRSHRPSSTVADPLLSRFPDPFAEGNETETPDERFAVRLDGSAANGPGWLLRIVPNRYPTVEPAATPHRDDEFANDALTKNDNDHSFFPCHPACGEHDVVIECPDSRSRMAELSVIEIQRSLVAWRTRLRELSQTPSIQCVSVFRNEGFSAGASLTHCHSQIVATADLSPLDHARHERAARHRETTGRDLVQDLWKAEHQSGVRLITETEYFGVCCPFASRVSCQMRFVPKQIQSESFADASDAILHDLAMLLKSSLRSLETILNGPFSFNLTLSHPRIDRTAEFSWSLDLLPRTGRIAGFEFLTDVNIVTVAPEDAATRIRAAFHKIRHQENRPI